MMHHMDWLDAYADILVICLGSLCSIKHCCSLGRFGGPPTLISLKAREGYLHPIGVCFHALSSRSSWDSYMLQ